MTLTVSKGYSQKVDNVVGLSVSQAQQVLEDAGFTVKLKVLTPPTSADEIKTMKTNVVITQSIPAFTVVTKKRTTITLGYYNRIPTIPSDENTNNPTTPSDDNTTNEGEND